MKREVLIVGQCGDEAPYGSSVHFFLSFGAAIVTCPLSQVQSDVPNTHQPSALLPSLPGRKLT